MKASERDIRLNRTVVCLAVVAVLLMLPFGNVPAALSAPLFNTVTVPNLVGFEGYLTGGTGQPISDGAHNLVFRVYDAATSGTILWTETQTPTVTSGLYSVVLGISTTFSSTVWNVGPRWIGVTVDGGSEITPRTEVVSVPFALNAEHANSAESATSSASASSVPLSGITGMPSGAGTGITITVGNSISLLSAYQLPQGCSSGQVVQSIGGGWNCLSNVTTGNATSGQIAIWGPSNTLAGTSGLLSANNTLTVTNGLNVGSAVGATGGQIRASGTITGSNLSGTNTGDATKAGENYLSLSGQAFTANAVDLSSSNATGVLAAARFPALTGDVTTSGGLVTTIGANAVTNSKLATAAQTLKGNIGGGTADLGVAAVNTMLGTVTGSGTTNAVAAWSNTNVLMGNSGLTWDGTLLRLTGPNSKKLQFIDSNGSTVLGEVSAYGGALKGLTIQGYGADNVIDLGVTQYPGVHGLFVGTGSTSMNPGDIKLSGAVDVGFNTTGAAAGDVKASGNGTFSGGLNVGSASGAAAGDVKASGNETLSGGLNVGSASGAAAGTIRTAGRIYPNNQTGVGYGGQVSSLGQNGVAQVSDVAATTGFVFIADVSSGNSAMFTLRGGLHTTGEVQDPDNHFSATKNTANSINVYWDTTNARYEVQNTFAGTHALYIYVLSVG